MGRPCKSRALEDTFLFLARADDLRELRRACAHFRNCATADGTEPREHDGFTLSRSYDGRVAVNGSLSSSSAEIVVNAIHALTDPPSDDDRRTA